ncbi:MAG TPA: hypothetical protein VK120_03530 [Sporosarcina sp.]|nr:hypothetical protein [Sporosarcina sp.]
MSRKERSYEKKRARHQEKMDRLDLLFTLGELIMYPVRFIVYIAKKLTRLLDS